jgi:hypothetical protein
MLPFFDSLKVMKKQHFPGWIHKLAFYYPFTVPGTILVLVSLVLFGRSYTAVNSYGFVLSGLALVVLFALSLTGRLQTFRFSRAQVQWDSNQPLYAGMEGIHQRLWAEDLRPFPFYRIHFRISGTMTVGKNASLYISQETSSSGGKSLEVPLYFPLCGAVQARGSLKVRDIFGLTRARFGRDMHRTLIVQPAPFSESRSYPIEAVGGLEDKTRQRSSDEERYYMREYIPGDRFRDINWKSSSRLSQLITRISPYTQEKKKLIFIDFRHFRSYMKETAGSLVHLNQLKSWILGFLRRMKHDNPDYQFLVKTGIELVSIETEEDIQRFSLDLSTLFFQPEPSAVQQNPGTNEVFIFTTPYDETLHDALAQYQNLKTYVLRTAIASEKSKNGKTVHLFKSLSSLPLAGPWVFLRDRDVDNKKIRVPMTGAIEEYPIVVKLF